MASKKGEKRAVSGSQPALRIGSRVRCTEDGVQGRIVWANAVAIKIKWEDGEQVTWRRDSLHERPVEILDPDEGRAEGPAEAGVADAAAPAEVLQPEPAAPAAPDPVPESAPQAVEPAGAGPAPAAPEPSLAPAEPAPAEPPAAPVGGTMTATPGAPAETPAKPRRPRKASAEPKEKKVSALDAAARVLAEAGQPMSCQEMIGVMAAKGAASRFAKAGADRFALASPTA